LPSGQPLDARLNARLSAAFSVPVSHVRLHTDARAARLADALNAEAFTAGSHIFFAADRSPDNLSLLAHETAHALQQPAGGPRGLLPLSRPESVHERAADEAGSAILAGRSASIGTATPMHIARKGRGLLGWALEKLDDPEEFLEDVVKHPIDATVGDASDAFVEGVKADAGDVADLGSAGLDAMRDNAAMIRKTGDAAEAWLVKKQKEGAAATYADADAHSDSAVLGPLLHANAWLADQTGQVGTGIAGGAVTLLSGVTAAASDPVDTGAGLLKLAPEVGNVSNPLSYATSAASKYAATGDTSAFNPLAKGTAIGSAWEGLSKPYARAIDEGRYSEAGGRLWFDVVSLLVGAGETGAVGKGSRTAPLVGAEVDALAKTVPAGVDLARTAPAVDDLARTASAGGDLAPTIPGRPMPTEVLPGTPAFSPIRARQYLKLSEWMDDFFRPQPLRPAPNVPIPTPLAEVEAAAGARTPVVTHLSESFHQTIWESIGGTGKAPVAYRNKGVLFVDYENLPASVRDAVDAAKDARSPGAW
jgi:hypothetical protein